MGQDLAVGQALQGRMTCMGSHWGEMGGVWKEAGGWGNGLEMGCERGWQGDGSLRMERKGTGKIITNHSSESLS